MRGGAGRLALALAATLAATPLAARAAAPVEGVWRTAEGDGLVQIRPCGANYCGYLVDAAVLHADPRMTDMKNPKPAMRARPMMELLLLDRFAGGPVTWDGGHIYDPRSGKSYQGILKLLDAGRLKVTGCLIRPLCGSQVWARAQ